MTQVDFYILDDTTAHTRERFACRLVEKAFGIGHRVYLHTASSAQSNLLNDLLWTFRQGSFLPHRIIAAGETPDADTRIYIGHEDEINLDADVLINLSNEVPLFFSRYERVAEVLDGNPELRALGREWFRFYRDRGYTLNSHNISTTKATAS